MHYCNCEHAEFYPNPECGQPLVMWRADTEQWKAVQVQCPQGLYPHQDADGQKIYENTHFTTPEKAWERLERESMAWLSLRTDDVARLEQKLAALKNEVVEAGKAVVAVHERRNRAA